MRNMLDCIVLTPRAVETWQEVAAKAARTLSVISADDIPDEDADVLPDGRLRIFVAKDGKVLAEHTFEVSEWDWSKTGRD